MWLEDQEQEEAELDSMRAAEAPGNASAEQAPPSAGAAAPPLEPPASFLSTARSQAAAQRKSELSGGFGAPPPEVAMSPQDQRRWEAFIQEVNPYDFPVRTVRSSWLVNMHASCVAAASFLLSPVQHASTWPAAHCQQDA